MFYSNFDDSAKSRTLCAGKTDLSFSAYEPFHKECLHCIAVDFAVVLVMLVGVLFISTKGYDLKVLLTGAGAILALYFLVEFFLNYRLSILARLEKQFHLIIADELLYEDISEEFSFSGRWGSILPKLYPKEKSVGRFRVRMRNREEESISLRCAVCGKQWNQKPPAEKRFVRVVYGKYSHIILSWEGVYLRKKSGLYERSFIDGPSFSEYLK